MGDLKGDKVFRDKKGLASRGGLDDITNPVRTDPTDIREQRKAKRESERGSPSEKNNIV